MTIRNFISTTFAVAALIPGLVVFSIPVAGLDGVAFAQDGEEIGDGEDGGDSEDADDDDGLGFSGSVTWDNSVGIGSFYREDTTEIIPALTFIVSWLLPGTKAMKLSVRQDLTLYGLGAQSAYTDVDPGENVRASDTLVTWSSGEMIKDEWLTGIALSSSLRFYVPTSKASQTKTLILGVGPGAALKRKFGFLTLSASTRAKYAFQRYDNSVITVDQRGAGGAFQGCAARSSSKISAARDDQVVCGGTQNADWTWYNGFGADFQVTKAFTLGISLTLINSFGIPIEQDEFTSPITARTNNETQRDSSWGIVDLSYDVTENFGLSAGISSLQSAKSADGEHIRFPWWDLEGPQNNATSLYFDVIGSF